MGKRSKLFNEKPDAKSSERINEQVRVPKVRLILQNGDNVGVVATKEALQKAKDASLDLVEVSPNANPPVCKIMDYGKVQYEKAKAQKENVRKSKSVDDKEIRLRPSIGAHDLEIKAKKVREFLSEGRKVAISVRLRGRERAHPEVMREVIDNLYALVEDVGVLERKGGSVTVVPK